MARFAPSRAILKLGTRGVPADRSQERALVKLVKQTQKLYYHTGIFYHCLFDRTARVVADRKPRHLHLFRVL